MNYLAHAFLSFDEPEILAGNMISDFVKGRNKYNYPPGVQKGITLHRLIDAFTDEHTVTRDAKQYFREAVGLYAGAFVDVAYDHFLALDASLHTEYELQQFAQKTYRQLDNFTNVFPDRFARMFPYMKSQNWLYHYRTLDGMENSFGGVARRAVYLNNSVAAFEAFMKHYDELKICYEAFFPDIHKYARGQFDLLVINH